MSSVLTRRRGGGGGGAAGNDGENSDHSRVNSPASRLGNSRDTGGPETSYENGENGHKIAFDPRDINESAERSKQPKLTLMEEVLLLGLKDKQVSLFKTSNENQKSKIVRIHFADYIYFFLAGISFFLE